MTKYYKQMHKDGQVIRVLTYNFQPHITDPLIIEITEEEYNALLAEIQAADAPDPDEISDDEALNIILGVRE